MSVTAAAGCAWTAQTDVVVGQGTGPATATLAVVANPSTTARAGSFVLNGTRYQVSQQGSAGSGGGGSSTTLIAGQHLSALTSPDGRFLFVHQGDGNVVLYQGGTPLGASQTTAGPDDAVRSAEMLTKVPASCASPRAGFPCSRTETRGVVPGLERRVGRV